MTSPSAGASILWRRLDQPGHDHARVSEVDGVWRLDGCAIFDNAGEPARLDYQIACDDKWQTRSAYIAGWVGNAKIRTFSQTVGGS